MKHILLLAILLFGASFVSAQNLNGRYKFVSGNGPDPSSFYLKFERQDAVYFSYFHEGAGTIGGKWTKEGDLIKAVLTRGDENWTLKFNRKGSGLKVAEALPEKGFADLPDFKAVLPAGAVFKKLDETPTGPALSPEEIGARVLKLVKSVRSLADISPENVKRQTGVKVAFHSKDRNQYGFGGNVIGGADWAYGFSAYPYPSKDNKTTDTLRFSFDYQLHEPLNPDTGVIKKAFDFETLSKELQEAGFSAPEPAIENHRFQSGWRLERGKVSLWISIKGGFAANVDNTVTGMIISFTR